MIESIAKRVQDHSLEEKKESALETEETLLKIGEKEHNIWKTKIGGVSGRRERLATINAAKKAPSWDKIKLFFLESLVDGTNGPFCHKHLVGVCFVARII